MWQTYLNVPVWHCGCMCDTGSLWLVRLALFIWSPPSPDSSLRMIAATSTANTLPLFFWGGEVGSRLKANKLLFSCQSSDKDLGLNEGMKWKKQMSEQAIWTEGELIRCLYPEGGRSHLEEMPSVMKWTSLIFELTNENQKEIGLTHPHTNGKKSLCSLLP